MELPKAYEEEMKELLKEEYSDYIKIYELPVRQGLRFNRYKLTEEKWKEINPFSGERIPWVSNGYYIENEEGREEGCSPSRHPYYYAGLYYIQEPSAMTPASRLPITPGDKVLDMCAAPGGKATELGGQLKGKGLLLANDLSSSRAKALLKNMEMTGLPNFYVSSEEPQKLKEKFKGFFDKILIDAPCSGEGMFHKEPKMMQFWEEKPPEAYAQIQKKLVLEGADMLKPGGMLLYSTCTFSKKENEEVIAFLLRERPDMETVDMEPYEGFAKGFALTQENDEINCQLSRCVRIFPHKMPGEGHFVTLLRKKGETLEKGKQAGRKKKSPEIPEAAQEFLEKTSLDFRQGFFKIEKDKLYFLPGQEELPKFRYLRTGLYLGEMKKNRFEPSQALAMALSPDTFDSCVCLSAKDIRTLKYLKGETIDVSDIDTAKEKGWQLVCVDGFALGFGKLDQGILKNKYYAGWRIQ